MPHFCPECGSDEFICQKCGKIYCSNPNCSKGTKYHWSTEITRNEHAGAICDDCYNNYQLEKRPFAKIFPKAIEDIKNKTCPTCGEKIGEFRDNLSLKEYRISGMCQKCQDKVFGGEK